MGTELKRLVLLLALMEGGCADRGMENLSDVSLAQFEATKIALEEAKSSGKKAVFQRSMEIRRRLCTNGNPNVVTCSYEMREMSDSWGTGYENWMPIKRTFKKTFWTRGWVEAEPVSQGT
jgi:hypothetical protein